MARGQSDSVLKPLQVLLETGTVAGMTDGQLLERFAARRDGGAEAAFAALVSRHGPMVLGVCRHWLGDEHAAEDAFQAVFLVLARRAGSIRRPELLSAWLYGVAARIAEGPDASRASAPSRGRGGCYVRRRSRASGARSPDASSRGGRGRARRGRPAAGARSTGGDPLPLRGPDPRRGGAAAGLRAWDRQLAALPARGRLHSRLLRRGLAPGAGLLAGALEPRAVSAAVPIVLERATVQAALLFTTHRAAAAGIASAAAVELAGGVFKTMTWIKLTVAASVLALGALAIGAGRFTFGALRTADPRSPREQAKAPPRNPPAPDPSPRLPGAVTEPPAWLIQDAPFDVAAFFAVPPPEENAAPRYLEALFEFGVEVAVCFPEGPERESRKQAVEQRSRRFAEVLQASWKAPHSVPAARIDAVLGEYDAGFRKLDWAQQRPRCVFQTAIGVTAQVPHAQVARQVARVAALKIRRELERDEFDAALRDLARLLRFSRDLLPQAVIITDFVAAAIDGFLAREAIVPLLATPGLTVAHCDRLLALLAEHEARSVDPYIEGLRAEYVSQRATLHALIFDQDRLRKEWSRFGNPAGPSIVAEIAEPTVFGVLASNVKMPQPGVGQRLKAMADQMMSLKNIKNLDALMARTTPEELAQQVQKLNALYRGLLDAADASHPERIRGATRIPPALTTPDLQTRVTRGIAHSAFNAFIQVLARWKATMRVAQGLVAVRRWQLRHGGELPPSLAAAVKEAGWSSVPLDPYDNRPIRFAVVDGQPTVYSIGQDGRDDGGKIDNVKSPDSGDVLLRLPKP